MTRLQQLVITIREHHSDTDVEEVIKRYLAERDACSLQDFDPREGYEEDVYDKHDKQSMKVRRLLCQAFDTEAAK